MAAGGIAFGRSPRTRRLGDELFGVLPEKFAGTGVDFSEAKVFYEDKMK